MILVSRYFWRIKALVKTKTLLILTTFVLFGFILSSCEKNIPDIPDVPNETNPTPKERENIPYVLPLPKAFTKEEMFKDNIKVASELFVMANNTARRAWDDTNGTNDSSPERHWLFETMYMYGSLCNWVDTIRDRTKEKDRAKYRDLAKKHMDNATPLRVAAVRQIEQIRREVTLSQKNASSDVNFTKQMLLREWDKLHLIMPQADGVFKKLVEIVDGNTSKPGIKP
jgi:DNA-binding transcriptional regulator YiaG